MGRRRKFEQWKSKLIEMQQLGYSAYGMSQETGLCYVTIRKYWKLINKRAKKPVIFVFIPRNSQEI